MQDFSSSSNHTLIIGAGIAGVVSALELLDQGCDVTLLDRQEESEVGGLARWAFGGMALVDTPLQRRSGIRDSAALALDDWLRFAQFGPDDDWPRRWAEYYVTNSVTEVYDWLRGYGLRFIPAVQWVERGWEQPGNSVPRYHVLWGTSEHMTRTLVQRLRTHPQKSRLRLLCKHRVTQLLTRDDGTVVGCKGLNGAAQTQEFELYAPQVIVAGGGITGDLARVRQAWPKEWGAAPRELLNGSHPAADGKLHDAVAQIGGRITHLEQMWNYVAGVDHPQAQFPGHGLSLIPTKSALWVDPQGRRIGPSPFVTGFDTLAQVERMAKAGWSHTWQVLNRRIAVRELAASGALHNVMIRDRRILGLGWQMLRGNAPLVDELLAQCKDFVTAPSLPALVDKMNELCGDTQVSAALLAKEIAPYDAQIERGPRFHNDEQLRRIAQLRLWMGDRWRTCAHQRIMDPHAGPLIAIRCRMLTRKSMGGIQTDLDSRVLGPWGQPVPGLYAAGEAAGFGGGGANGRGSLEGTFLSGCILTARAAARHIGQTHQ